MPSERSVATQKNAFEGRVTQFLPGHQVCFVTLSVPIGSVRRALLHTTTLNKGRTDPIRLKLGDEVCGKLILRDASIGEVIEVD
jgi:hypothetical protein